MDKFRCELFGHFVYDAHLSYHDLIKLEMRFIGVVQSLLTKQDADHIDFTPMGDALMVQCVFYEYAPERFRTLCEGLRVHMPPTLAGRLLFIDKGLDTLYIFHVSHDAWRERALRIPSVPDVLEGTGW